MTKFIQSVVKLKVATIVGTRSEIIRLSRVLAGLDENCEYVLIHTGFLFRRVGFLGYPPKEPI